MIQLQRVFSYRFTLESVAYHLIISPIALENRLMWKAEDPLTGKVMGVGNTPHEAAGLWLFLVLNPNMGVTS
jgi:hypothetical protein